MQPGDPVDDPVEGRLRHDRIVPRTFPRDELHRQVGHQDGDGLTVRRRAEVGRHERLDEMELAAREHRLANRDIVRCPHDPVRRRGGSLEDEPSPSPLEDGQRRARPAVIRERCLRDAGQPMPLEQLRQGVRRRAFSMGPGRHRLRRDRRRGRRRANRGNFESAPRPAARSRTRSLRRGPRRPGCR